jgi:hypothetical protein
MIARKWLVNASEVSSFNHVWQGIHNENLTKTVRNYTLCIQSIIYFLQSCSEPSEIAAKTKLTRKYSATGS